MELRQYAAIAWKWLWLIVLGTALAGGTALVVSLNLPPVYEAAATLLIQQADSSTSASNYTDVLLSQRLADTYAALLRKPVILEAVASQLGLEKGIDKDDVSVGSVSNTQLIELKVRNYDPQLAANIANTIPVVFSERNASLQLGRFSESKAALSQELSRVQADIELTQTAIKSIGSPNTAAEETELGRLQTALAQYRSNYATLLSNYEAIRLAEAQAMDSVIVFQEATVPEEPVLPNTKVNVLLAAAVGAALAIGIAFPTSNGFCGLGLRMRCG